MNVDDRVYEEMRTGMRLLSIALFCIILEVVMYAFKPVSLQEGLVLFVATFMMTLGLMLSKVGFFIKKSIETNSYKELIARITHEKQA